MQLPNSLIEGGSLGHSPGWTGGSSIGWLWLVLAADWPAADAWPGGGEREPTGLLGESGHLVSAVLVVAVTGRWGILVATGAVCWCGKSLGEEIFPSITSECTGWIVRRTHCYVDDAFCANMSMCNLKRGQTRRESSQDHTTVSAFRLL